MHHQRALAQSRAWCVTKAAIDRYVAKKESPYNIDTHIRSLTGYVAELRDALALAEALGRTLILPRWTCYCDRLWSGSDDIFHFGCMYPGAQDGQFVPFVCPMDHVVDPAHWHGVQHRRERRKRRGMLASRADGEWEEGMPYRGPYWLRTLGAQLRKVRPEAERLPHRGA